MCKRAMTGALLCGELCVENHFEVRFNFNSDFSNNADFFLAWFLIIFPILAEI